MRQNIWKYQVEKISEEDARMQNEEALAMLWDLIARGAIDLHVHSNTSDGKSSPAQLVQEATENRLRAFALTDHDTVSGIEIVSMVYEKLYQIIRELPDFIPGVEVSAKYEDQEIHMLAYYPKGNIRTLEPYLEQRRKDREARNRLLCEKVQNAGLPIKYEELVNEGGNVIGRLHMAQLMIRRGFVTSVEEAFRLYLGEGQVAYVRRDLPQAEEVIQEILLTGGVPVLAHPAIYKDWMRGENKKTRDALEAVFAGLMAKGLQGVEVIQGEMSHEESEILAEITASLGLLPTVGSDYHGSHKPQVELRRGDEDYRLLLQKYFGEKVYAG